MWLVSCLWKCQRRIAHCWLAGLGLAREKWNVRQAESLCLKEGRMQGRGPGQVASHQPHSKSKANASFKSSKLPLSLVPS